jgi:hypothetical protein
VYNREGSTMRIDRGELLMGIAFVLLLVGIGCFIYYTEKDKSDTRALCEQKGGIMLKADNERHVCVRAKEIEL